MPIQRGDVILCQLPLPSTGLVQFKLRPAVVVSKDVNNQRLDDVIVAPCTSNISRSREPTQCLIGGAEITSAGIRVPSVVRCEALMTIPKTLIVRTLGHLTNLLAMLKGLPTSYDNDMQEDKEPLFDAVDTLDMVLPVIAGVIRTMRVNADKMRAALDEGLLATDLTDYLVRRGVSFRDAHRQVGEAVKLAEARGIALSELSVDEYKKIAPEFGADVVEIFDFARSVESRGIMGGTGPNAVREQIQRAKQIAVDARQQ